MKVPGNYFADFTEKMTESLPEREFPELVQPSLWPPKINLVILKNNLLSYYFYVLQHKNKAFVQDNK